MRNQDIAKESELHINCEFRDSMSAESLTECSRQTSSAAERQERGSCQESLLREWNSGTGWGRYKETT
ncbi:unnamed protein product [Sordaria macrospora k-hell]|uniref:WGS project CABT00000000 data, contig 2.14 n=1 Tax=Sordaria macrospora (strain ATCC MYA-333 / DSM 997 / K(L3346) / K-hell) TaxID=771870 RepID=F7VYY4_SORMK|nr:uncharacterized protein SMAC_12723 [Sordaria macrospora k-hell]CCC10731.1 unnamed protein product [Sordaria macrospora k-hell]